MEAAYWNNPTSPVKDREDPEATLSVRVPVVDGDLCSDPLMVPRIAKRPVRDKLHHYLWKRNAHVLCLVAWMMILAWWMLFGFSFGDEDRVMARVGPVNATVLSVRRAWCGPKQDPCHAAVIEHRACGLRHVVDVAEESKLLPPEVFDGRPTPFETTVDAWVDCDLATSKRKASDLVVSRLGAWNFIVASLGVSLATIAFSLLKYHRRRGRPRP